MEDMESHKVVWVKAIDSQPEELKEIEALLRDVLPDEYVPIVSNENINVMTVEEIRNELDKIVADSEE